MATKAKNQRGSTEKKTTTGATVKKMRPQLGPAQRMKLRMERMLKRVQAFHDRAQKWGQTELAQTLNGVGVDMGSAISQLGQLPADFRPSAKGGAGKAALTPGMKVRVRASKVEGYADLLSREQLQHLEVQAVKGNKARVRAQDGSQLFFPRAHLEQVEADQARAAHG